MCVDEGGPEGRPSRRQNTEKAQRRETEEHMPDLVLSSMIYCALHQHSTWEGRCRGQGGEVGVLGLITEGLNAK